MLGVNTSGEKERILREEPEKLKKEIEDKQKELGLRGMIPKHGQNALKQLDDMKHESNHIREVMQFTKERRIKKQEEERKAKKKSPKEILRMILSHEERKAKESFNSRRQVFISSEWNSDNIRKSLKMFSYRVFLREIEPECDYDGIIVNGSYCPETVLFRVEIAGDDCDDVSEDDIVLIDKYAGIEIVFGKDKYRLVSIWDILAVVEKEK